jgi:predicted PurR-regulated permease PerM
MLLNQFNREVIMKTRAFQVLVVLGFGATVVCLLLSIVSGIGELILTIPFSLIPAGVVIILQYIVYGSCRPMYLFEKTKLE